MLIFGIHACREALSSAKNKILKIHLLKDKSHYSFLKDVSDRLIKFSKESDFQNLLPKGAVHQGIAIEIEDVEFSDISDLISAPQNCVVAILDNVTDPHNLGAIIRSAATLGISGIILPEKSSCKINGTVAKAASGGLEHVSIYVVKNISQTIEKLKKYGFWIVSFCERGEKFLHEVDLKGKSCLIFGSEGSGIRRLSRENSDFIVKLPTNPEFPTMNVSTSAAVAFYEAAKQNNFELF